MSAMPSKADAACSNNGDARPGLETLVEQAVQVGPVNLSNLRVICETTEARNSPTVSDEPSDWQAKGVRALF